MTEKKTKEAKAPETKDGYLVYLTPDKGANQVLKPSGQKATAKQSKSVEWVWFRTNVDGHGGHLFKSKAEATAAAAIVGGDVRKVTVPVSDLGKTVQK